jgi:hypothetical protein
MSQGSYRYPKVRGPPRQIKNGDLSIYLMVKWPKINSIKKISI